MEMLKGEYRHLRKQLMFEKIGSYIQLFRKLKGRYITKDPYNSSYELISEYYKGGIRVSDHNRKDKSKQISHKMINIIIKCHKYDYYYLIINKKD